MTLDSIPLRRDVARRGPALTTDARALGLRRRPVQTAAGRLIVRAGRANGGTALVLLHGAAGSWTTWTPLLHAAMRTGESLPNVVAIDLPGWGESRASGSGLDIAQLSTAVIDVVEQLGYDRWIIVGHSLGGFLALDVAARSPERTDGVLLVSSSGPAVIDAIRRPLRGGAALPAFAGMLLIMRLLAAFESRGSALVRALHVAGALRAAAAPLFAAPAHVHRTVIDALAGEIRPRAFAAAARAAAGYDISRWGDIACPVRAVSGEHDVFVADSDHATLARLIPDYTHTTLPEAGHFGAVEQPERVLRELQSLAGRSAPVLAEAG